MPGRDMPMISQALSRWILAPVFRWSLAIIASVVAGVLLFQVLDISIFHQIGMPHEYCYLQSPKLIWLHVLSDGLIGGAYVSISITLGYLVYRGSKGIPFHWVFLAFGLFIISCGATHFMEVWVIWQPMYWLSGYVKVVTAAASVATAIALFPLIPKVFSLIEAARKGELRRIEIEQLNQELERFNYSVAHDLRAPLRGIAGMTHILREDLRDKLSEAEQQHMEKIVGSVARMDALINDLLRYSTVGRKEMNLRAVALEEPIRNALDLLEQQLRETGGEVVLSPTLPKVVGDTSLLQVVFQNLISNSLKFIPAGVVPRVEISAAVQSGKVTVVVADNGIGIPEQAREKVFRMFERFSTNYPGTGMGLAIVHRAIERMHGTIGVNTAKKTPGAEFWIQLPAP
jgi:signal transduction histidine kinase